MSSVILELEQWGPDAPPRPPIQFQDAQAYTWKLATTHYENFPVISWAVPRRLRAHFANVYAFCRWADDLGDETGSPVTSLRLLDWWQHQLEDCYRGTAHHPVYVALSDTIERFQIPIEPFSQLISAFVQDQTVTEYNSFKQLQDYCCRSASPVGRIVLHLAERVSDQNLILSNSICIGLQLANFWQDVARDLEKGRIYLPREDRLQFGYLDEDLQQRRMTSEFRNLMTFEVERSRGFLLKGQGLIRELPGRLKVDIDLFLRGGLLVLDGIRKIDYDVWQRRPVVRKTQLLAEGAKSLLSLLLGIRSLQIR